MKAGLTVVGLKWAFPILYVEFWHPLTWLSLMLDTQLFGVAPGGYLFSNLLLHILNALLLFIFFLIVAPGRSGKAALWQPSS